MPTRGSRASLDRRCARGAVLLAVVCGLLAGCATPDVRPFAEQTARLATAVAGEQREIAQKLDEVIQLYDQACKSRAVSEAERRTSCDTRTKREQQAKSYAESRRVIDGLLDKSSQYASSLAELAAAGDTGGEAARSLLGSLKQFGAVLGVGGMAASETVAATLEKIGTAVTRVQAQRSLAEAAAAAQPAIVVVADGIRALHQPTDAIAGTLLSEELDVRLTLAGADRVGLFQDAAAGMNGLGRRLNGLGLANLAQCGQGGDAANCRQLPEVLRSAETLGRVLEQLRPEYEAYLAQRAAAVQWRAQRKDNLAAIARAAAAWQAEHARVAEVLARCGGLYAYRCARVDAATLKAAVDVINEIRSERSP